MGATVAALRGGGGGGGSAALGAPARRERAVPPPSPHPVPSRPPPTPPAPPPPWGRGRAPSASGLLAVTECAADWPGGRERLLSDGVGARRERGLRAGAGRGGARQNPPRLAERSRPGASPGLPLPRVGDAVAAAGLEAQPARAPRYEGGNDCHGRFKHRCRAEVRGSGRLHSRVGALISPRRCCEKRPLQPRTSSEVSVPPGTEGRGRRTWAPPSLSSIFLTEVNFSSCLNKYVNFCRLKK